MNIDEQLQELKNQRCPKEVDVVDSVMAQVRTLKPVAKPRVRPVVWRSIALTAAAAVAALVVMNVAFRPSYNVENISSMMAYVSDYDYYLPVEELAENPIDFLYE